MAERTYSGRLEVRVDPDDAERSIRKFMQITRNSGVLDEHRRRQEFVSRRERRRLKDEAASRRKTCRRG